MGKLDTLKSSLFAERTWGITQQDSIFKQIERELNAYIDERIKKSNKPPEEYPQITTKEELDNLTKMDKEKTEALEKHLGVSRDTYINIIKASILEELEDAMTGDRKERAPKPKAEDTHKFEVYPEYIYSPEGYPYKRYLKQLWYECLAPIKGVPIDYDTAIYKGFTTTPPEKVYSPDGREFLQTGSTRNGEERYRHENPDGVSRYILLSHALAEGYTLKRVCGEAKLVEFTFNWDKDAHSAKVFPTEIPVDENLKTIKDLTDEQCIEICRLAMYKGIVFTENPKFYRVECQVQIHPLKYGKGFVIISKNLDIIFMSDTYLMVTNNQHTIQSKFKEWGINPKL